MNSLTCRDPNNNGCLDINKLIQHCYYENNPRQCFLPGPNV